jgi:hypothetical protein
MTKSLELYVSPPLTKFLKKATLGGQSADNILTRGEVHCMKKTSLKISLSLLLLLIINSAASASGTLFDKSHWLGFWGNDDRFYNHIRAKINYRSVSENTLNN